MVTRLVFVQDQLLTIFVFPLCVNLFIGFRKCGIVAYAAATAATAARPHASQRCADGSFRRKRGRKLPTTAVTNIQAGMMI